MMPQDKRQFIAIIPARGGSKGIPGKNLVPIAGKPLIVHTIEAALGAKTIQQVYVSTDDAAIGKIAAEADAKVIHRPTALATDTATSESTLLHALEWIKENEGYQPEYFAFLQCTSPLTQPADIDGTMQLLMDDQADSAFAASEFHHFLWETIAEGSRGINHHHSQRFRRQDINPQYLEAGSVYAMKTEGFLEARHRFFGRIAMHEIPASRVFEIDEPKDLIIAESLMNQLTCKEKLKIIQNSVKAVILDFDGVFTDNKVIVFQDGTEAVICDRGDGMGIEMLKKKGIPVWVISKEKNPVLTARCKKLKIECYYGIENKWNILKTQLLNQNIDPQYVVYMGNDINDIECMKNVGFGVAPSDAHPEVIKVAVTVMKNKGGDGAIRELSDMISNLK
jgi:YrbI family 3-deoxy-D-manno-octulosonate 8-phosphate phosphatase